MSRRYELIVFDWDGTLMDSTAMIAQSIQLACKDLGLPVPSKAQASHVIGLGLADALAQNFVELRVLRLHNWRTLSRLAQDTLASSAAFAQERLMAVSTVQANVQENAARRLFSDATASAFGAAASPDGASRRGRQISNSLPRPGAARASTVPPCRLTSDLAIARPNPEP